MTTALYIANVDGKIHWDLWYTTPTGAPTFTHIPAGAVTFVGNLDAITYANIQAIITQLAVPTHANKTKPGLSWGNTT